MRDNNVLMFGQSQKASWFQKVLSNQIVGKGVSSSGLAILKKVVYQHQKSSEIGFVSFTQCERIHK